jgi:alpha-glucosidase (family GH31 glycosyl hydrolase)
MVFAGGQTITIAAPLEEIPVFVKDGAPLPFAD